MRAPAISGRHDDAHTAPHYVRILVPERPPASRQVPNPDTPAIRADARPQRAAKPADGMRFLADPVLVERDPSPIPALQRALE